MKTLNKTIWDKIKVSEVFTAYEDGFWTIAYKARSNKYVELAEDLLLDFYSNLEERKVNKKFDGFYKLPKRVQRFWLDY